MDDANEAIATILKMSPPLLLMVAINVVIFAVRRFVAGYFLTPLGILLGAGFAPLLIHQSSIAYDVPSPLTAQILTGAIMGFVAVALHDKFVRLARKWGMNGDGPHYHRKNDSSDWKG